MDNNTIANKKVGFLFDLDGVLIDSEKEYTSIWTEIDRQFPSGYENLALRIKGMTLTEIIDTYFPAPSQREGVRNHPLLIIYINFILPFSSSF